MPDRTTTKRWVIPLLIFLNLGIGALVGVSVARNLHHRGGGWFGSVIMGIFFGVLSTLLVLFMVSNLPREIAKVIIWRRDKRRICGVLPVWIPVGLIFLLLVGGLISMMAGLVSDSPICFAISLRAMAMAVSLAVILAILGLCHLCWKRFGIGKKD
jgi:uncharacterized membrane protein YkvI